jgi:phosphotransferase system enzyme I (PtsP)
VGPIKELVRKVDLPAIQAAMDGWLAQPPADLRAEIAAWATAHGIDYD